MIETTHLNIQDNYEDTIKVKTSDTSGNVHIQFYVGSDFADMSLTPKAARKVAKAIKRAAKAATG